ncbi:hypothetical protein BGZ80_004254 [Entomortierella chlamydospora]|uniref:Uncharacterized protein n=1 Tax=Entomortierella chlamydospora TaxID=101097 RepID=A0A9P6N095_9FUNG|nr:hypothetical protein BGZ80_004254 [Entomortierella chlamydospora]
MSSFSNLPSSITAATSDPDSVSISISSSSPTSSVLLPSFTPSSSSSPSSNVRNSISFAARDPIAVSVTGDRDTIANLNSNDRPTEVGHRNPSNGGTEADDRIHFRLLNNIYFSASARQSRLDDDLGMDLTAISNGSERLLNMNRENSFMMVEDRITGENGMGYGDSGPRTSMFTDQGEEFASIAVRSQSDHPESIDDEDDGDDNGADQVTENRRLHNRGDMSIDLEHSSSSISNLERPRHAQLSPRSAAALTSMFSDGRTSWPQPILNSSISSDLIALSEGRTGHEYNNNPYFRRPAPFNPVREIRGSLDNVMGADASRSRSTSTQYDTVRHDYNSQIYLHRSGTGSHGNCGERTPVSVNEAQGDVWPLRFEIRSNNINICLKLAEPHQTFVLTQFRAKAPTTGFTAPCKEGLIFVSHEPIPLEKTAIFDNMTRERYDEYMQGLNQGPTFGQMLRNYGSKADALIPAAFFQMEGPDETCTLDLTPNRSGRYVIIKLLRSKCTNPLQRPENIDLQYLGLIGYTGARSFASGGLL